MEKVTEDNNGKTSYSAEELEEFREIILKKLEIARENLDILKDAIANGASDADDAAPTFKVQEEGSNVLSKEENAKQAYRQEKFIKDLEAALIRIENKTYGICRVTGKLIPKERLRLVPHTTMSVEAKLMQKNSKIGPIRK